MGTDIHWALELQHPDGGWEAVASKTRVYELDERDYGDQMPYEHPWKRLGHRDYGLFGLLSSVRYEVPGQECPLAHPGLPEDASAYARANFAPEANPDYHTEGWFTLGELARACQPGPSPYWAKKDDREILVRYHKAVLNILRGPNAMPFDTILVGREYGDGGYHPDLRSLSNHARLELSRRVGELLPPGSDTARIVVAYDN